MEVARLLGLPLALTWANEGRFRPYAIGQNQGLATKGFVTRNSS